MEDRMKQLNQICMKCQNEKLRRQEPLDPIVCSSFCHIGREVHSVETSSGSPWIKVDWNDFKFKDYYHGWKWRATLWKVLLFIFCCKVLSYLNFIVYIITSFYIPIISNSIFYNIFYSLSSSGSLLFNFSLIFVNSAIVLCKSCIISSITSSFVLQSK